MKRIGTFLIALGSIVLLTTGCVEQIPDLTAEQQAQIVEYAAGLLLKYDKSYSTVYRLEDITEEELAELLLAAEQEPETADLSEKTLEAGNGGSETGGDGITEVVENVHVDIAQFLELEGIQIEFSDYQICDSYPTLQEEALFPVDATDGSKLVVFEFMIQNVTAEDKTVDILSKMLRIRFRINGEKVINALSTLLLNDFKVYNEVLPAGDTKTIVLLIEMNPEAAESINTVQLIIKADTQTATKTIVGE